MAVIAFGTPLNTKTRTYYPDNEPIKVRVVDEWTLELTQPTEKTTGIQKRLRVSLSPDAAQCDRHAHPDQPQPLGD
jgi:hypothetical protein